MVIKLSRNTGKFRAIRGHFFIPKDVRKLAIILIINIIKIKRECRTEVKNRNEK